jgi:hypothetical protein
MYTATISARVNPALVYMLTALLFIDEYLLQH